MNIYEMLEYQMGTASNEELGIVILWNGSSTFNVFADRNGTFTNTDVWTSYGDDHGGPLTVYEADQEAQERMALIEES